ncbi:hypothetical protein TNCT_700021 [Trichonephila clavata]|uniref:Uncharacterized protein n=1 Tax=Trichonephila clavata TaxID=2740835 RepID=A0A8X6G4E8_TRICU|nr:hypothetical protein TNCT_700021 [Trichonephila clavata]
MLKFSLAVLTKKIVLQTENSSGTENSSEEEVSSDSGDDDVKILPMNTKSPNDAKRSRGCTEVCELPASVRSTFLMSFSNNGELVVTNHGDHNIYLTEVFTGKTI